MPRFTCIFACQFQGRLVRKGERISASDDQLKLPSNAVLLNPRSFRKEPDSAQETQADPAEAAKAAKTARAALLEKCAALKLTVPKKATNAEISALIAEAADPAGHPAPQV